MTPEELDVANLIKKESNEFLKSRLQVLHQIKLGAECLTNQKARDKVDIVINLILIELRKRKVI